MEPRPLGRRIQIRVVPMGEIPAVENITIDVIAQGGSMRDNDVPAGHDRQQHDDGGVTDETRSSLAICSAGQHPPHHTKGHPGTSRSHPPASQGFEITYARLHQRRAIDIHSRQGQGHEPHRDRRPTHDYPPCPFLQPAWIILLMHFSSRSVSRQRGYRPKNDESGMVKRVDKVCREARVGNPQSTFPQVNIIGRVTDTSPRLICVEDPQ